ncbi:MAG: L-threonylcarbamoyladenylate synthase [Ginsengibacter sp.]
MNNYKEDISNSLKVLSAGGIILYPSDTIWGIGCDATNELAIKKISHLKKREEKKSMIILLAHENDISQYVSSPSKKIMVFISKQLMPTTAIFENAINLPGELINVDGSIAIRIVRDRFCQQLIKEFKKPLISTSANISGNNYPRNFNDTTEEIKNGVDYIVQHRKNDLNVYQPSSIIKLNSDGKIEILR